MRLAAVQMISRFGQLVDNSDHLAELVRAAAKQGAELIVTPELCLAGYASDDLRTIWHGAGQPIDPGFRGRDVREAAETVPGPSSERFGKLARELGVDLTIGLIEQAPARASPQPADKQSFFNTMLLLSGADGRIAAHYRKRHLWPVIDPSWATPGCGPPLVVRAASRRVGLAICYDVNWMAQEYASRRPEFMLLASAWVDVRDHEYFVGGELPEIARSLGAGIIFANRSVGSRQGWYGSGRSCVIAPDGTVLASARRDFDEEIVAAELP